MSCLAPGYNPVPTRQWTRVENRCPTNVSSSGFIYVPILKKNVPVGQLAYEIQMLAKGNVLQYKANSSNLTLNQRYSKIAQGQWTNRTTTWASQSETATNPNTTSLKRINTKRNITLDGSSTTLPVSLSSYCRVPTVTPIVIPLSGGGSSKKKPSLPPKPKPKPNTGPVVKPFPPYIPPSENPVVIQDGGTLVCTQTVNPCTGEVIYRSRVSTCNLTTASDVPGRIQLLCYNQGLPTYYPRQRYIMTNSGNKWPQGVKYLRSANSIQSSNAALKQYLLQSINKTTTTSNTTTSNTTTLNNETGVETGNDVGDENEVNSQHSENDEFLNAYNNIIYDSNIELITNYLNKFLTGDFNTYLKNILTTTEVTTIQNNIYLLENYEFPSLTTIINIYNNILSAIFKCINECDNNIIDPDLHEKYKTSDEILNNATLLKEFLSKKPSSSTTLFDVSVEAPLLEINPIYVKYIALYGIPKDFIFDPELLASLQ